MTNRIVIQGKPIFFFLVPRQFADLISNLRLFLVFLSQWHYVGIAFDMYCVSRHIGKDLVFCSLQTRIHFYSIKEEPPQKNDIQRLKNIVPPTKKMR